MAVAKKGTARSKTGTTGRKRAQVAASRIQSAIHRIRGQRVMLDASIAELYEVETRVLVQAVTRNLARFPDDFMFRLTDAEHTGLRSQSVISNSRGGRRTPPYAFTEQGVAMLSSVLRSPRAVKVNVEIMRAFVTVFDAIRALVIEEARPRRRIGFHRPPDEPPV